MGKKACTQIAWTERSSSGAKTESTRTVKWELLQESQPYQTCTHYDGPVAILYFMLCLPFRAFQWLGGKESTCQFRRCKRRGFNPWVRKILWRRKWQPTPVFLPGKSHGHRSLAGYSPQGCKELDVTKWLSTHASLQFIPNVGFKEIKWLSRSHTTEKNSKNFHPALYTRTRTFILISRQL